MWCCWELVRGAGLSLKMSATKMILIVSAWQAVFHFSNFRISHPNLSLHNSSLVVLSLSTILIDDKGSKLYSMRIMIDKSLQLHGIVLRLYMIGQIQYNAHGPIWQSLGSLISTIHIPSPYITVALQNIKSMSEWVSPLQYCVPSFSLMLTALQSHSHPHHLRLWALHP